MFTVIAVEAVHIRDSNSNGLHIADTIFNPCLLEPYIYGFKHVFDHYKYHKI